MTSKHGTEIHHSIDVHLQGSPSLLDEISIHLVFLDSILFWKRWDNNACKRVCANDFLD